MEDLSTPPLFDLKARQLTWRYSAHLLHFNDGLSVTHFTKTTISPFQVITWHVSEIPVSALTETGKYGVFRRAMTEVRDSQEARDVLVGPLPGGRKSRVARSRQSDGAVNYPSWWVE